MSDGLTIVIADDHPLFRKGLAEVLRAEPQLEVVAEAAEGEAALAAIERFRPRLAILDVDMPKLTGPQVAEAIRERGLPTIPILLTMYAEADLLQRALDLGIKGYVLKDNAVGDIVACVHLVAEGRTYLSPTASHLLLAPRADGPRAVAPGSIPGLDELTRAERAVLGRIARSLTTKEIAAELGSSPKTIENHRSHICAKLGLSGTNALVRFALEHRTALG
ncbi:MAG: response regulator [Gemmatimonadales bacterium]